MFAKDAAASTRPAETVAGHRYTRLRRLGGRRCGTAFLGGARTQDYCTLRRPAPNVCTTCRAADIAVCALVVASALVQDAACFRRTRTGLSATAVHKLHRSRVGTGLGIKLERTAPATWPRKRNRAAGAVCVRVGGARKRAGEYRIPIRPRHRTAVGSVAG